MLELLALSGNGGLNGTLPSSLYELSNLRMLYLDGNDFSGSISQEVGQLILLQQFTISDNPITGVIPSTLGLCKELELLLIDNTDIQGTIPEEFCQLKNSSRQDYDALYIKADCYSDYLKCDCCDVCCDHNTHQCFQDNQDNPDDSGAKLQENQTYDSTDTIARTIEIKQKIESEVLQRGATFYEIDFDDPRYLALEWILNQDEMRVPSDAPNLVQRYVLALIAFSLDSEAWDDDELFPSWFSGEDECTWYNVSCFEGRVLALQMNEYSLKGFIPPEIGRLESLALIQLQQNSLHGTIPQELVELPFLMGLDLSWNNLTGIIPENIGHANVLEILSLQGNELNGTLPNGLFELTNLKYLFLGDNGFSGSISENIEQLANLRQLTVSENPMAGTIPSALGLCKYLESLNIYYTNIEGTIPEEVCLLTQGYNNLQIQADCSRDKATAVPFIKCDCCKICCDHNTHECKAESDEQPSDIDDQHTTSTIASNSDVTRTQAMEKLEVEVLHRGATFNEMASDDPRQLALNWILDEDGMGLDFNARNFIQRYTLALLAYSLDSQAWGVTGDETVNLRVVESNFSWLSSVDECSWYNVTCTSGVVTGLWLDEYSLIGTIPPEISRLVQLDFISFRRNCLYGTIPSEMGQLSTLTYLRLQENALSGTVPDSIFGLSALEILYLQYQYNNDWACTRSSGEVVNIYFSEGDATNGMNLGLIGKILDDNLANLTSLRDIRVGYNQFSGVSEDRFHVS